MMQHPYYLSPKAEQRLEAIEKNYTEALKFLTEGHRRPVGGRVLEPTNIKKPH